MKIDKSGHADKTNSFTLIELLVVIAIIAILAALLLPALAGSKRRAKLAQCQSNFHQISVACFVYANSYDDYFPPNGGKVNFNVIIVPSADARIMWTPISFAPNTPAPEGFQGAASGVFQNLGCLYETRGIGDGKVLFCPSFPDSSLFSAAHYSHPSFMSTDINGDVMSTMLFNPHVVDPTGLGPNANARLYPKTSGLAPGKLFGMDCIQTCTNYVSAGGTVLVHFTIPAFTPDTFAHYSSQGFDVLFTDGSVEFVQSVPAFNFVASSGYVTVGGTTYILDSNVGYGQLYMWLEEAR